MDECSKCGTPIPDGSWLAQSFRQSELRAGRRDPGFLCKPCIRAWTARVEDDEDDDEDEGEDAA